MSAFQPMFDQPMSTHSFHFRCFNRFSWFVFMFLTIGSSGSKTGGDSFAGKKKKKKKGKARDEMHVKLIVFL